jgi:hypothetical protein
MRRLLLLESIVIIFLAFCHFPLENKSDEDTINEYNTKDVSYGGRINPANISDLDISRMKIQAVNSFSGWKKVVDVEQDGSFSFSYKSLQGSKMNIYAFIDDYASGTEDEYDEPFETIFVLLQTSGGCSNTAINIDKIYKYYGTITRHTDTQSGWNSAPLLARIYNASHYIYYYQRLAGDTYALYFVENHVCYVDIGPSSDLSKDNIYFIVYTAQIYGAEQITANKAQDFTIRKVSGTITINDPSGDWASFPLYLMIGASDWNAQNSIILAETNVNLFNYTIFTRNSAGLTSHVFIDKNFSGNCQEEEPISPSGYNDWPLTGIPVDTSGGDVSDLDFTIPP